MKSLVLICTLFLSQASLMAASCYSYDKNGIDIKWTAFKTPKKVGVNGKLPHYTLEGKKKGSSVAGLLKGQKIEIALDKVESGDKGRDIKIVKFFFNDLFKIGNEFFTFSQIRIGKIRFDHDKEFGPGIIA